MFMKVKELLCLIIDHKPHVRVRKFRFDFQTDTFCLRCGRCISFEGKDPFTGEIIYSFILDKNNNYQKRRW
jgi:hypothetical protein